MFILPPGHVHLWAAQPEQCQKPPLLAHYRRLLDETETADWLRFRVEKKRREHLVARALVRTVLSRYAPVRPEQWRFRRSPAGKPAIDWPQILPAGIEVPANPPARHDAPPSAGGAKDGPRRLPPGHEVPTNIPGQPHPARHETPRPEGPGRDWTRVFPPGGEVPANIPGQPHPARPEVARPEGPGGDWTQVFPPSGEVPTNMPSLEFNLSHTEGMILCAVTAGYPIGVDIEDTTRPAEFLPLARRFFHPAEIALLENLPTDQLPRAFYRLWTLKEAYLKAVGAGLTGRLDAFGFRWPTGQMPPSTAVQLPPVDESVVLPLMEADAPELVLFSSAPVGQTACWQFREFLLEGRFQVALAVAHPPQKTLQITLHHTIPLGTRG